MLYRITVWRGCQSSSISKMIIVKGVSKDDYNVIHVKRVESQHKLSRTIWTKRLLELGHKEYLGCKRIAGKMGIGLW